MNTCPPGQAGRWFQGAERAYRNEFVSCRIARTWCCALLQRHPWTRQCGSAADLIARWGLGGCVVCGGWWVWRPAVTHSLAWHGMAWCPCSDERTNGCQMRRDRDMAASRGQLADSQTPRQQDSSTRPSVVFPLCATTSHRRCCSHPALFPSLQEAGACCTEQSCVGPNEVSGIGGGRGGANGALLAWRLGDLVMGFIG